MVPAAPRAGDVIVTRMNRSYVGLLIATESASHSLYAPCPTMWEALLRARQVAASLSVDVWHHTPNKTLECIASYRKGDVTLPDSAPSGRHA